MSAIATIITVCKTVLSNLGAILRLASYFFNPEERSRKRLASWKKRLDKLQRQYNLALAHRQVDKVAKLEKEMNDVRKEIKLLGV